MDSFLIIVEKVLDMQLLANENFPIASVRILEQEGFDVLYIGIFSPGISDKEVMELAKKEDRLILTFDRDYGELIFKYNYLPPAGVVYLRFEEFTPTFPGEFLSIFLKNPTLTFKQTFTVVDEKGVRQKKY